MKFALIVVLGALTGVGGWFTYTLRDAVKGNELALKERDERIEDLEGTVQSQGATIVEQGATIEEQGATILQLEASLYLLKVDRRVARIEVVDQGPSPDDPDKTITRVRFMELDDDDEPLGEGMEIELEGTKIYLETLVIKFEDTYVEGGDFLRGTSVCLFQRMFSENQAPTDGTQIDAQGVHPHTYGGGGDSEADLFYAELWQQFWEYANDPEAAKAKGVRAMHGEAPFVEARPGKSYKVELRASGGLSITPEE